MKKRLTSWLLVLTMIVSLIPSTMITASAADVSTILDELPFDETGVANITRDSSYILTGDQSGKIVKISDGTVATLLLRNVTMESATSPIQLGEDATLTLIVADDSVNTIKCTATEVTTDGKDANNGMTAGIHVPESATLTIDTPEGQVGGDKANGQLAVTGGYGGAGIGGNAGAGLDQNNAKRPADASGSKQGGGAIATNYYNASAPAPDPTLAKGGLAGKDAEAAGTITIKSSVLTAAGGYGAAGIGGGMGATGQTAVNGVDGKNGSDCWYRNPGGYMPATGGGSGATGGTGGTGGIGGSGGNVTISGGTVTATGSNGAAGIGGGIGGFGGQGGNGGNGGDGGETKSDGYFWDTRNGRWPTAGGGGQGGSGGQGGTGGVGGSGGTLSITGGAVKATGADTGIGGGSGGQGGIGGSGGQGGIGNNHSDQATVDKLLADETGINAECAGGQSGYGGTGGNGGAGTQLSITGGSIEAIGSTQRVGGGIAGTVGNNGQWGANADSIKKTNNGAQQSAGYNTDGNQLWSGGYGTTAHAAVVPSRTTKAGAAAGITIDGTHTDTNATNIWTNFTKQGDDGNWKLDAFSRPKDILGNDLYLYTVKVTAFDGLTAVEGATVKLQHVQGGNGNEYTYSGVSNADGYVQLWLPLTGDSSTYTLKDTDVYSETAGWMHKLRPLNIVMTKRDNGEGNARITPNFTLAETPDVQVYFQQDSNNPATIKLDASKIPYTISAIKWFVEPILSDAQGTLNMNKYDSVLDRLEGVQLFSEGYNNAKAKGNGDSEDKNAKVLSLPINQNGRYWFEVEYSTDQGGKSTVVNGIQINNIYREYPIKVRQYITDGTDKNNQPIISADTGYQPLPGANGEAQAIHYGFAWDLNGYDASKDLDGSKLLPTELAAADEIKLYPKSDRHTWYTALLKGANENFASNSVEDPNTGKLESTDYVPVTLTLNKDLLNLNNNNNKCDEIDGKKNPDKYTIVYSPREGVLNPVFVYGEVKDDGTALYKHVVTYLMSIHTDKINALEYPGYKLVGVKIERSEGEQQAELNRDENGNLLNNVTISDIHGFETKSKVKGVTFLYEYNMTDVTVNAVLNDAKKDTADATKVSASYKEKLELGTEHIFTAPAVTGYNCVGSSLGNADYKMDNVTKDATVTFYYEKAVGNVSYRAVDGTDGTVLWTDSGEITQKGAKPEDKTPDKGVANYEVDTTVATKYTITGTDTTYPNDGAYNGLDDITVTYTYKHKTRNVVAELYDIAKRDTALGTTDAVEYNVGGYETINAPALPEKYKYLDGNASVIVKIEEGSGNQVVKFYCEAAESAVITVRLYDSVQNRDADKDGTKAFQTMTIPATFGVTAEVKAPSVLGWILDDTAKDNEASKKVTPEKDGEQQVVNFVYKADYVGVKVILQTEEGQPLPQAAWPTDWENGQKTFQVQKGQSFRIAAPSVLNYKLADAVGNTYVQTLSAADILKGVTAVTFKYTEANAEFYTINVKGMAGQEELYSYTTKLPKEKNVSTATIDAFVQAKYELTGATIGGTDAANKLTGSTLTVDLPSSVENEINVVFNYTSKVVDVTIKMLEGSADSNKAITGYDDFTVQAEKGTKLKYTAPAVEGYELASTDMPADGVDVQNGAVITFYYRKANIGSNVTYVAVEKGNEGNVLAYGAAATVEKDGTIDTGYGKAPQNITNWRLDQKAKPVVTGAAGSEGNYTYDGQNNVTVKFFYTPATKTVKVVKMDADTISEIDRDVASEWQNLETGKTHSNLPLPTIGGYSPVSSNVSVAVVDDNTEQSVTVYYRRTNNKAVVTVKLYVGQAAEPFHTYQVPGVFGVAQTITAPNMKGYTTPQNGTSTGAATANCTPVAGSDNVVEFKGYARDEFTVTVRLLNASNSNADISNLATGFETEYKVLRGDSLTVAAPSIDDYTLNPAATEPVGKGARVVTLDAQDIEGGIRDITFYYKNTGDSKYVKHTVIGKDTDNSNGQPLFTYTTVVDKGEGSTVKELTYYAPYMRGYSVDQEMLQLSNTVTDTITFNYTKNEASVKFVPVDKDGQVISGLAEKTIDGLQTGLTVTVEAPYYEGKVLLGYYGTGLEPDKATAEVTLQKGENVVRFAYADQQKVTFILKEKDGEIIRAIDGTAGTYGPSVANNKLNLSDEYYTFVEEGSSDAFKNGGTVEVSGQETEKATYTLMYTKKTRAVTYKLLDVTNGETDAPTISAQVETPENARVGEIYIAAAPQIAGYTLQGSARHVEAKVAAADAALEITFKYVKKATGSVTVKHMDTTNNKEISAYTVEAAIGEAFTANALQNDRYTLTGNQTQTITVAGSDEITFNYTANFVEVSAYTNVDSAETYYDKYEILKGDKGSLTIAAPSKTGYVLNGITVKIGSGAEEGSATTYPTGKWNSANSTLTISNVNDTVKVVYYYVPLRDAVKDEQATITIKSVYNGKQMGSVGTKIVDKDVQTSIPAPEFEGYKVTGVEVLDKDNAKVEHGNDMNNPTFTPDKDSYTVTFTYARTDNSVVIPGGGGGTVGGDGDITVKPTNPDKETPTPDKDGTITIPDGGGTVTKPGKPGEGNTEITVPGGSTVDKDGNIKIPEGDKDGTIKKPDGTEIIVPGGSTIDKDGNITTPGGEKLDPDHPENFPEGYALITYKPNGGSGKDVKQIIKGGSANAIANPFTSTNDQAFQNWNEKARGNGKSYAAGEPVTVAGKSLELYAQWKDNNPVKLSIKAGSKVETVNVNGKEEYILVMRGSWAKNDKTYIIPVLEDGEEAVKGNLRWYVDAYSYITEFGFTNSVLTGDDIVSVNAQTGEIKVKNSGIVRIYCESADDPSVQFSVIFVVPGDLNKDGFVDMDDVTLAVNMADPEFSSTDSKEDKLRQLLADLDKSGTVDMDDVTYLVDIATYEREI